MTTTGNYQNYVIMDGLTAGAIGGGGIQLSGTGFQNLAAGTIITIWEDDAGTPIVVNDTTYDPGSGDYTLAFSEDTPFDSLLPFNVTADDGMDIGGTADVIVIGIGGEYFLPRTSSTTIPPFYDPLNFRFGLAVGSPQTSHSTLDIDVTNLNVAANGGTFALPSDYDQAISVFTPGAGNNPANIAYINGLRGVAGDNPDIFVQTALLPIGRTLPTGNAQASFDVDNGGSSATLTVNGGTSSFAGTNPTLFGIAVAPANIAAGTTNTMTIQFTPAGFKGRAEATLTIQSNDQSGDTETVDVLGFSADPADYAGLFITEVISDPATSEMIEILNTSASPIDISGVVVTDEDRSGAGEGMVSFPASTSIAAGEYIVLAVGIPTTADPEAEPAWLDSVPTGVRVFYEPRRAPATWTPANGNTLTVLTDVTGTLGTSGNIGLATADSVALMFPGAAARTGVGIFPLDFVIDGVNFGAETDLALFAPINSTGQTDSAATRAGSAAVSLVRSLFVTNVDSSATFFPTTTASPGQASPLATNNWSIYE